MSTPQLYRQHELAFRTQYAELKERVLTAGELLPGTPGTLARRTGTGHSYWYRVYYPAPGKQAESLVCKEGDEKTLDSMRERMEFAEWVSKQVVALRKLGFQVADKSVAQPACLRCGTHFGGYAWLHGVAQRIRGHVRASAHPLLSEALTSCLERKD